MGRNGNKNFEIVVTPNYRALSQAGADKVVELLRDEPSLVIGWAWGNTPLGMDKILRRYSREGEADFRKATVVAYDEYVGIRRDNPNSGYHSIYKNLVRYVKPKGFVAFRSLARDQKMECDRFEKEIASLGGIDYYVTGIGPDHILFVMPERPEDLNYDFDREGLISHSRAQVVPLSEATREANSVRYGEGYTLGLGNLLEAKWGILTLASGFHKASPVYKTIRQPPTSLFPPSALQFSTTPVTFILDQEAASQLSI